MVYFAVSAQGRWRTAADSQEFDIYLDTDADGRPDVLPYNTRLPGTDVQVAELVDLGGGAALDAEPLDAALGDTDTALLDSDTLVMPVAIAALPGVGAGHTRIGYDVAAYSAEQDDPVDVMGVDDSGDLASPMSIDVLHPGVASAVALHVGRTRSHVHLRFSSKHVRHRRPARAVVSVTKVAGVSATGAVRLISGTRVLAHGRLAAGKVRLRFTWKKRARALRVRAVYAGDVDYTSGRSPVARLRVR